MAVKLLSSTLPKRFPNRVFSLNAFLSSLSSSSSSCAAAINIQPTELFESKLQFLNKSDTTLISTPNTTPDLNSSHQNKFQHTTETYHTMILKLGMSGNVDQMEALCGDMVRNKCPGFEKSISSLINSFVANHRLTEALKVLHVMNLSTFNIMPPSIGTFNALMCGLVEEKRGFKDVLFVYKEMVKMGICPNVDTLNYLLESLFVAGKIDTAMDQYRRMRRKGCEPNVRTFEILISGLANTDLVEESIVMLNEMFQYGCEPDFGFYIRIIPIFCRLRNLEIGLRLFKMMRDSSIAPDCVVYDAMIRCLCEYLQMDDAIKLFEEMIGSSLVPDNQVYLDIIHGFCKLNKFTEARNFLVDKGVMDISVHNALLGSCCESGNFTMAKDMFDEMFELNITDARSWNILIRCLCEKPAVVNKALEYLCRMIVSSFHPDSATYSALIVGNCKSGKVEQALGLFCQVRSKCWVLDFMSYGELIECLCSRGDIQEAMNVCSYYNMSGKESCVLRSKSLNILIKKMCESGEVSKAIKLLSSTDYTGATTYNNILQALSHFGQESYILETLSQMIVNGRAFEVETYCILIQSMTALNRLGDCVFLFNLMLSQDLFPDSETLACLLSFLAKYSQVHLIASSIDKLATKSEILDSTMYNMLINSLWGEEHKSEASHFLDLMLEKGWVPDASTHVLLMGSNVKVEMVRRNPVNEKFGTQDNVSSILVEGLGES